MAVFSRKPVVSLKWGKTRSKLLLITDQIYLHARLRLIDKSVTLGDLEQSLRTPFQNTCIIAQSLSDTSPRPVYNLLPVYHTTIVFRKHLNRQTSVLILNNWCKFALALIINYFRATMKSIRF